MVNSKVKAAVKCYNIYIREFDGTDPTYGGSMTGGTFSKIVSNEILLD